MKRFFCSIALLLLFFAAPYMARAKKGGKATLATIETNKGAIRIWLFDQTPLHKQNFLTLIEQHFYDSLLFHRVIKGFVIQTGDPQTRNSRDTASFGKEGAAHTIKAEIVPNMHHIRGAVGAAREPDIQNPDRNSSGSHFYIVQGNNKPFSDEQIRQAEKRLGAPLNEAIQKAYRSTGGALHLDGAYTIFGHVICGMEVVDAIAAVRCTPQGLPIDQSIRILSVTKEEVKYKKLNEKICNKELKIF